MITDSKIIARYAKRLAAWVIMILLTGSAPVVAASQPSESISQSENHPSGYENRAAWPSLNDVQAKAWVVYDRTSGQIIFGKNERQPVFPASTTKILTAVLALETLDLDQWITVSETAVDLVPGSSKVGFNAGDVFQARDLLAALMIASGNDAANILAEAMDGSIEQFAGRMNRRAKEIGMMNTHFSNPSGLHDDQHITTALDMAILTDYAMGFDFFNQLICQDHYVMPTSEQHPYPDWALFFNTNRLLFFGDSVYQSELVKRYNGVKTGSTPYAHACLVASAELIDGKEIISVLMGLTGSDQDHTVFNVTRTLLEEGAKQVVDRQPTAEPSDATTTEESTASTTTEESTTSTTTQESAEGTTPSATTHVNQPTEATDEQTDESEQNRLLRFISDDPWRAAFILLAVFLVSLLIAGSVRASGQRKKKARKERSIQPRRVDPR